jgi:hypothetical protein
MELSPLATQPLALPLLGFAALYLLLLRPWRPLRLIRNRVPIVDALFVASLVVGASTLHYPEPYVETAHFLVDQTDLPETLDAIDDRIEAVEGLPETLWHDLKESLGFTVELPPPLPATPPAGRVEAAVMPAVIGLTEGVLRCTAYAVSLLALALCQALRLVAGIRRAVEGRPARRALEERVAALEESLARMQTPQLGAGGAVEPKGAPV